MLDPENPVVKLCAAGIQAEMAGRMEEARVLYLQAWESRRDDLEACIAAHYLARQQDSAEAGLHWNRISLEHAERVNDERVNEFYPSLYLNLGWAYENTGSPAQAAECYRQAAAALDGLPAGPYRDMVAQGIAAGQQRVADRPPNNNVGLGAGE